MVLIASYRTAVAAAAVAIQLPQLVELPNKHVNNVRVVGHHHVLVIAHHSRAGPVEGAVNEQARVH